MLFKQAEPRKTCLTALRLCYGSCADDEHRNVTNEQRGPRRALKVSDLVDRSVEAFVSEGVGDAWGESCSGMLVEVRR